MTTASNVPCGSLLWMERYNGSFDVAAAPGSTLRSAASPKGSFQPGVT